MALTRIMWSDSPSTHGLSRTLASFGSEELDGFCVIHALHDAPTSSSWAGGHIPTVKVELCLVVRRPRPPDPGVPPIPHDEINALVEKYLGSTRRAGQGTAPQRTHRFEDVLARTRFGLPQQFFVPGIADLLGAVGEAVPGGADRRGRDPLEPVERAHLASRARLARPGASRNLGGT